MNAIGKPERASQNRVTALFKNELGYRHLGDWTDRANGNVEDGLLGTKLGTRRYSATQISSAIYKLRTEASNPARSLYQNNQAVYSLLRYGVPVKSDVSAPTETVHLIDWQHPGPDPI